MRGRDRCLAHSYKISSEISRLESDDPVVSVPPMNKMKRKGQTGWMKKIRVKIKVSILDCGRGGEEELLL